MTNKVEACLIVKNILQFYDADNMQWEPHLTLSTEQFALSPHCLLLLTFRLFQRFVFQTSIIKEFQSRLILKLLSSYLET